ILGYFTRAQEPQSAVIRTWNVPATVPWATLGRVLLVVLRVGAVLCLLLTIATTLIGNRDPMRNAGMSMFWFVFLLGFTYFTALAGNLYSLINPWRTLLDWTERLGIDFTKARIAYPQWLGYYPAFVFYVVLIWFELFALPDPRNIAWIFID